MNGLILPDVPFEEKEEFDIPCAVGFGISTPEQAKNMAEVKEYVKSMKDAVREN